MKAPSRDRRLHPGKLPIPLLNRLLKRYTGGGERVVIGPSVGIDAAAIDFGDRFLLAKTDPITFVAEDIGAYAVHVNANDIAVMGGIPKWFLVTVLLPEGQATSKMVEAIFSELNRSCKALRISLCGGHTEITPGIDRPIVIGQMLGEVTKERLITSAGAKMGDILILTKGIALEGTSILARERGKDLEKAFSRRFVEDCKRLIRKPGISVLKDALAAVKHGRIHAMHDPTEGGLATGLHEMAMASHTGVLVEASRIPIFPETLKVCRYFGLDPLGIIASGALLMAVEPRDARRVLKGLKAEKISASAIGHVTPRQKGVQIVINGKKRPLPLFGADELTRVLK